VVVVSSSKFSLLLELVEISLSEPDEGEIAKVGPLSIAASFLLREPLVLDVGTTGSFIGVLTTAEAVSTGFDFCEGFRVDFDAFDDAEAMRSPFGVVDERVRVMLDVELVWK
jgi:hypothetical protein